MTWMSDEDLKTLMTALVRFLVGRPQNSRDPGPGAMTCGMLVYIPQDVFLLPRTRCLDRLNRLLDEELGNLGCPLNSLYTLEAVGVVRGSSTTCVAMTVHYNPDVPEMEEYCETETLEEEPGLF